MVQTPQAGLAIAVVGCNVCLNYGIWASKGTGLTHLNNEFDKSDEPKGQERLGVAQSASLQESNQR